MPLWTCLVWNLIFHIPSVPSLEISHAINIRLISMKLTRSTLNDPKYTHTKNHTNLKRLSYRFWYLTKTAITFGEECIANVVRWDKKNCRPVSGLIYRCFQTTCGSCDVTVIFSCTSVLQQILQPLIYENSPQSRFLSWWSPNAILVCLTSMHHQCILTLPVHNNPDHKIKC